jgi:hypothetical protein
MPKTSPLVKSLVPAVFLTVKGHNGMMVPVIRWVIALCLLLPGQLPVTSLILLDAVPWDETIEKKP